MSSVSIHPTLRNAVNSFRFAESEFSRPNEDVVTLCVCSKMRGSVEEFLRSFLATKNVSFSEKDYFDDLLRRCTNIDSQFNSIDLSCFYCNQEHIHAKEQYCFSHKKMKDCFTQTALIKDLVLDKLNLTEKDFE